MIEKIGYPKIYTTKNNSSYTHASTKQKLCDTVSFGSCKDISIVGKNFRNKIKIIFSDIDGTISPHSDLLSAKTLETIDFLHSKKIPLILTTARCYEDTLPIIEQFRHTPDYTIVLQGGGIVDKNGKKLLENTISQNNSEQLVKWFNNTFKNDDNTHLIMYFDDKAYAGDNFQFPWKARSLINQIKSFDELFNSEKKLQKVMLYKSDISKNSFDPDAIVTSFNSANICDLEIKPSGGEVFEIQNKWVTKDKAISFILEKLHLKPKNAMAIGDSSNDIEMLDYIRKNDGLAVAMGHADSNVKAYANGITSDIKNEGFYSAIGHIF